MSDRVWMRYPETSGVAQFAAAAVEAWRDKGWEPCDPPELVNTVWRDPEPAPVDGLAVEVPAGEPVVEKQATKPSRQAAGEPAEEGAEQ